MNELPIDQRGSRCYLVDSGEWKGWLSSKGDHFNDHAGPFFHRPPEGGLPLCAMRVEDKHLNGGGMMHGGAIMTYADYCSYVFASALAEGAAVTISLHGEYLGAVPNDALVMCNGEVIRRTRSMAFVRGVMTVSDEPVFSFSAILKTKDSGIP